jgi:hypothetical protein
VTADRALAGINMADEDDIDVLLHSRHHRGGICEASAA